MFKCPICNNTMELPKCSCGHTVHIKNNIWQLTDMPDIVTEGDGDKYIGYEHIGENYSGNRKYLIENQDILVAGEISKITGLGIFLDLACGDGCFTVPCADNGTKIIAGDISNSMLSILQKKAKLNNISLDNVMLCRMNALDIPIAADSISTVVANSVLHLISNPEKVIREIHRVLEKDGAFICIDDAPGVKKESEFDNSLYHEFVNRFYCEYWSKLKEHSIFPKKYNWKFDRNTICNDLFERKSEKIIERNGIYELSLKDGFLPRMIGRGFSDQVDVPSDLHNSVIAELLDVFRQKYGVDYDNILFKGNEQDIVITIYYK